MDRRISMFPLNAHAEAPADAIEQSTGEPGAERACVVND
jgi:hypothetical protein